MAFQPVVTVNPRAVHLEEHVPGLGRRLRGCGRVGLRGLPRLGGHVLGGVGISCGHPAGAEEAGPEDERQYSGKHHHNPNLNGNIQLFPERGPPQEHEQGGGDHGGIQHHQQHQPVRRGVRGGSHGGAVGLGVEDVVAGPAHLLLGGVGAAVQVHTHEAQHHVAPGPQGQVDVHPAGIAHGGVGDHGALEAPLVPQNLGEQGPAGSRPGVAQVAVAAHHGGAFALLHHHLEGLQVKLPHGLFVGPHGNGQAVALLVVEGEVLHIGVHALAGVAPDHGRAQFAGQQGVLGVVLKVPPGIGGAVDVHGGGVQAHHMVGRGLRAEGVAEAPQQLLVPGRADQGLAGVGHALQIADQAVDARRAVQVVGGGLTHAGHLRGGPTAVGDHLGHVLHAELLQ